MSKYRTDIPLSILESLVVQHLGRDGTQHGEDLYFSARKRLQEARDILEAHHAPSVEPKKIKWTP